MEEEENVYPLLTPVIMNSDNESFDEGEERISFFSYVSYILLAEKLRSQISLVIRIGDGKEHEQFNNSNDSSSNKSLRIGIAVFK